MNLYDTLAGIAIAAEKLRANIGTTDRIMHEINGKIMGNPSQFETKTAWTDVYKAWVPLALNHPLVRNPAARLPKEDLQTTAAMVAKMREQALRIYGRWKVEMKPFLAQMDQAARNTDAGAFKDKLLRGSLMGAALLGGIAALKSLLSPSPAQLAAAALSPLPESNLEPMDSVSTLPSTPPMSSPDRHGYEFVVPPDIE